MPAAATELLPNVDTADRLFSARLVVLAGLSKLYVAVDQYRNNPEPVVMNWGFILVTLYMRPIELLLYVLADKEPRPGEHEAFIKPLWKIGVGSTIHCVAAIRRSAQ